MGDDDLGLADVIVSGLIVGLAFLAFMLLVLWR